MRRYKKEKGLQKKREDVKMEYDNEKIIKQLIRIMSAYKDNFGENDIQCELFHLIKQRGYPVRSEYPQEKKKSGNIHDLAVFKKDCRISTSRILHPIEIKVWKASLKKIKEFLCEKGTYHGGRDDILRRQEENKINEGSVILFNKINPKKEGFYHELINDKRFLRSCVNSKEYAFVSIYYIEFSLSPDAVKIRDIIKIHKKKICRMKV